MSYDTITILAREIRLTAAKIERTFGTANASRSVMLRESIALESQAKRLGNLTRQWFDEMSKNPLTRD